MKLKNTAHRCFRLAGYLMAMLIMVACKDSRTVSESPIFAKDTLKADTLECYDLPNIQ